MLIGRFIFAMKSEQTAVSLEFIPVKYNNKILHEINQNHIRKEPKIHRNRYPTT